MKTFRITPEVAADGEIFLAVTDGDASDRVGPLREGEELTAVLDPPNPSKGASPPTRRMKKLSQKQERRNAELLGGRTQPGSGSSSRAKGDVRKHGEWRGESKFTFAQAYALDVRTLTKIASECGYGERPVLFLDFKHKDSGRTHGSYVVLHETDFEELVKKHASSDD